MLLKPINMVLGLVYTPLLLSYLGTELYGLWAFPGTCPQQWVSRRPVRGLWATGRNAPNWPCLLSCPRQRQEPHGIRPHLPRLPPKSQHFRTIRPSCVAGRCWSPGLRMRIIPYLNSVNTPTWTLIIFIASKHMMEMKPYSAYWTVQTELKLRKMCGIITEKRA